jgi:hypothetical protein
LPRLLELPRLICSSARLRQPTEAENVAVNGEMIENLFRRAAGKPLQHAALVTGTKHSPRAI